jgi:hypothetical protein
VTSRAVQRSAFGACRSWVAERPIARHQHSRLLQADDRIAKAAVCQFHKSCNWDCQQADFRDRRLSLHCRIMRRSATDIQPEWRVPRKSSGRTRLGPVTRLFDLPDPERSFKARPGGLQTGDEIDGPSSHPRPSSGVRGRRLPGELRKAATILVQSVIEKFLTHLGLQARARLVCRPDGCPTATGNPWTAPG